MRMMNKLKIFSKLLLTRKKLLILICGSLVLALINLSLYARPKPSKTQMNNYLSITSTSIIQDLSFGTFCTGRSGGAVIVPSIGSRRATGDIILLPSQTGFPAILQFTTDNTNIVTLTTGNIFNLTSSSGGTITLQINDFYPASSFGPVIGQNNVTIGGILTVGSQASTPAGNYSGSFEVTFNEE
jgi:hypothetical protein